MNHLDITSFIVWISSISLFPSLSILAQFDRIYIFCGHFAFVPGNDVVGPANGQYNAYIDPSNPGDIVLSVPIHDEEFGDEQKEGAANRNLNENGYLYGLADMYKEEEHKEKDDEFPSAARAPSTVAVSVALNDDDDDDFAERPKVQPASIGAIGIAPPPKTKKAPKLKRKSIKQAKVQPNAAMNNRKGGPLAQTLLNNDEDQPMIKDHNSASRSLN